MTVYLASGSPRRKKILKALLGRFVLTPANIKETTPKGMKPSSTVRLLAERKARAASRSSSGGVWLGFDTIVYRRGVIFGKPVSVAQAARFLRELSGRTHSVYTGVCVLNLDKGLSVSGFERSDVRFRKLDRKFISSYSVRHMDKAGAYAVQEGPRSPVESIKGDYFNVVGFPVRLFKRLMRRAGVRASYGRVEKKVPGGWR